MGLIVGIMLWGQGVRVAVMLWDMSSGGGGSWWSVLLVSRCWCQGLRVAGILWGIIG